MNKVTLDFDKTITRLAGYLYGESVYEKQCKNKIDFSQEIILVFPDNIQKLASSFIQGFFREIVEQIGVIGIENQITIISSNENMKKEVLDNLF